jgi:hypothetical protein
MPLSTTISIVPISTKFSANWRDEFSIKVTSLDKALRLAVDYVIIYIADMAARFGSTVTGEFTLQQQNVKTKASLATNENVLFLYVMY